MCVVMTNISNSAHIYDVCVVSGPPKQTPVHQGPPSFSHRAVDCTAYSEADLAYSGYLSANKAIASALATLYGASCIVLSGLVMVYSFFLGRRCRKHASNWLTASNSFSGKRPVTRSVSFTTV